MTHRILDPKSGFGLQNPLVTDVPKIIIITSPAPVAIAPGPSGRGVGCDLVVRVEGGSRYGTPLRAIPTERSPLSDPGSMQILGNPGSPQEGHRKGAR